MFQVCLVPLKKQETMSKKFTILTTALCACLIVSNLFETKIFDAGPLTLTGGFLIFPVSYIINDCLSEVYGYRNARYAILLAFILNALFVGIAQVVRILPPETYWDGQEHFDYIFAADLRITIASMAAFVCGSLLNAKVMVNMKARDGEKRFGVRAIVSSLAGETCDSLIFFPIAFWGVGLKNLLTMMVTQIILKTLYEVAVLPLTSIFVKKLKASSSEV